MVVWTVEFEQVEMDSSMAYRVYAAVVGVEEVVAIDSSANYKDSTRAVAVDWKAVVNEHPVMVLVSPNSVDLVAAVGLGVQCY